MNTLITASLLSLITERIVAALVAPIKQRWPDLNLWWLLYPSWVLGGLIAYFANINLLAELVPNLDPLLGRVLTAVIVGGGANLLHDLFANMPTTRITATSASAGTMTATVRTDAEPGQPRITTTPPPFPDRLPDRPVQPRK